MGRQGAISRAVVTKRVAEDYVVEDQIYQVLADASGAAVQVTLVPKAGHTERVVEVQNVGGLGWREIGRSLR